MKMTLRPFLRLLRGTLLLIGSLSLLALAAQFTNLPWRAYRRLAEIPDPCPHRPSHILVMGGSGIPGESGLMRTFYAAQAAHRHPEAQVLVALPLGVSQSEASRAYLDELRLRGVPAERLRILADGRNTREQALRLAESFAGQTNLFHVLVVSDPEHIRRAAACIRKTCAESGVSVHLAALPAHPVSIEDPLPWRAAELDAPGTAPATQALVPDIGSSLHLRYNLWSNLKYSFDALREYTAWLYYRLRGWL